MTLNEYQAFAAKNATTSPMRPYYSLLGLTANLGNLASLHRKVERAANVWDRESTLEAAAHLADCLFYLTDYATLHKLTLEDIAQWQLERGNKPR